ncbi:hypothetical protein ATCC90586_008363 [Pythium insidiosum]|nr:hypothetical protein ATCC90586_008363 [Pythium insidiosum]
MASALKSYEVPQPWEEQQGTLVDRVVQVSVEAQRIYAQQSALLPTVHHDHSIDPASTAHLHDVGRRVIILKENAKKPDKVARRIAEREDAKRRVIPSRLLAELDDGDSHTDDHDEQDDARMHQRLDIMLMDQEWDTRTWNKAKIEAAIETLYDEIETSDDTARRELATTMLVRLLETREEAVAYVESTISILMNKAFKSLSRLANKVRIYRVAALLAVLAQWFAPVLSRDSATAKCVLVLLRETECCARIVQHHWRGVLFERTVRRRELDPSVRARLRSMHFIKNVELRHQFKALRDAIGAGGVPLEATAAYIDILSHLVRPPTAATAHLTVAGPLHSVGADQKRVLSSGVLVFLASWIPRDPQPPPARRAIAETVKRIFLELARSFADEPDKLVELLRTNVVERVVVDAAHQLDAAPAPVDLTVVTSALQVVGQLARAVRTQYDRLRRVSSELASPAASAERAEATYLLAQLERAATQLLVTRLVTETLLRVLPMARTVSQPAMCTAVLDTLRYLGTSIGFRPLLDALTRRGGRSLEHVVLCFDLADAAVVRAAVALFVELTAHPDARAGFTTAGAVALFTRWCDMDVETCRHGGRFVLALTCLVLLARQNDGPTTEPSPVAARVATAATAVVDSLGSTADRVHAFYNVLLSVVATPASAKRAALFLHRANVLVPILLRFLARVQPSDMAPGPWQDPTHRSISCIALSRFFKAAPVAHACFCERTVNHLALALQCNRLDELERTWLSRSRSSPDQRYLHHVGSMEACKALSRLARCPNSVDTSLKPSLTSSSVPPLPPAIVCDVMIRLHVLEDLLALVHVPTDAAEWRDVEELKVLAAVELIGYLRPMPFGETARDAFLRSLRDHPHAKYAVERLQTLVELAAPSVLHVLRETTVSPALRAMCCASLSRLAAINSCCSSLLAQGTLYIALLHVPEVLVDVRALGQKAASSPSKPMVCDAVVSDPGLLSVPASLFTLLGKLCAIADGRTALLRAQVMPRVLKRLQLTDAADATRDLDVKSEIAVLVRRLSTTSAVEGNMSELVVHFHVLELLTETVATVGPRRHGQHAPTHAHERWRWRVLDHVVGALAALAQDVLVCVPRLVRLDVLALLNPLFFESAQEEAAGAKAGENPHVESLRYQIVAIVHAIASYPFGEFDGYLLHQSHGILQGDAMEALQPAPMTLMDRVKRLAYDFKRELRHRPTPSSGDRPSIGELARETLAKLKERHAAPPTPGSASFPALPQSPKGKTTRETVKPRQSSRDSRRPESATLLPLTSPPRESTAGPQVSSVTSSGAPPPLEPARDLLSTRPPGPSPQRLPSAQHSAGETQPHYVFARPKQQAKATQKAASKAKHRGNNGLDDAFSHCLMLDPLFEQASSTSIPVIAPCQDTPCDVDDEPAGHSFYQELERQGHCVQFRGRRAKRGDRYFPSLARLHVENPQMNVL